MRTVTRFVAAAVGAVVVACLLVSLTTATTAQSAVTEVTFSAVPSGATTPSFAQADYYDLSRLAAPCGSWTAPYTQDFRAFDHNGEVWLAVRCTGAGLFFVRLKNVGNNGTTNGGQ